MLALGSVLAGSGVILVALLALLFRHPRVPRWASSELLAMLLAVPVTALIGFGLGHVAYGGYRVLDGAGGSPLELAAPVAVLVVLALVIVPVRRQLKAWAAEGGPLAAPLLPDITLSIDRPSPRAPTPPVPPRPSRRAA
jgi:hypothetical protein